MSLIRHYVLDTHIRILVTTFNDDDFGVELATLTAHRCIMHAHSKKAAMRIAKKLAHEMAGL